MRIIVVRNEPGGRRREAEEAVRRLSIDNLVVQIPISLLGRPTFVPPAEMDAAVAFGGDGTLRAVAGYFSALPGSGRKRSLPIGICPLGTGNDLAAALGIGGVAEAIEAVRKGGRGRFDLGLANNEIFTNTFGAGLDARAAAGRRRRGGYTIPALKALIMGKALEAVVSIDGEAPAPGRFLSLVAAIGPLSGGGYRIAPEADPADGLLDLVTIEEVGIVKAIFSLRKVARGEHLSDPAVRHRRITRLTLEGEKILYHLDGEVRAAEKVEVGIVPGGIEYFVPHGKDGGPGIESRG